MLLHGKWCSSTDYFDSSFLIFQHPENNRNVKKKNETMYISLENTGIVIAYKTKDFDFGIQLMTWKSK